MNDLARRRAFEAAVSVALAVVTLLAVPGMSGILAPGEGLGRLFVVAVVVHAVSWTCRRYEVPGGLAINLGVVFVLVAVLGAASVNVAVDHIRLALDAIANTPVDSLVPEAAEVVEGRLLIALLVVGLCSLLADQGAFRVRGSFLALTPSFSLVLVGAVRGASDYRAGEFVAYLIVALVFLMLHHSFLADQDGPALPLPAALANLAPGAAVLLVAAIVAAVAVAPQVPGFGKPAVVGASATGGRGTGSGSETISLSPIVDIRPSLVDQPATELFTVASDTAPSYWRLTSLDEFDGRLWKASTRTEGFPNDVPFSIRTEVVRQDFQLGPLSTEWLPAAYRPQSVAGPARLADNDTYSLRSEGSTSVNARYQVTSLVITPRADRLQLSPPVTTSSPAATRYLSLPGSLPKRIAEEARRVTAGDSSLGPYAVARSLQDWFRENFTYDQKVPAGNGTSALERFLFTTKRGYCEQFAGAYAVMARALGLPARVAVGFTGGELGDDGLFHVQGTNAHAWPEVYMQGSGWVAFEPTPGRGMPGAQEYTGVAPAQAPPLRDDPPDPTTGATAPQNPDATTPTTVGPDGPVTTVAGSGSTPTTVAEDPVATTVPSVSAPGTARSNGLGSSLPFLGMLAVAAVVVAALLVVPAVRRRRRTIRLGSVTGANATVLAAWWDAAQALARSGLARLPHETMLDHARRASGDDRMPPKVAEPVLVLAGRAGTAAYGTSDLGPEVAAESRQAAGAIRRELRQATPAPRRFLRALDPRDLWRNRPRGSGPVGELLDAAENPPTGRL